jgi:hypothetical protein
MKTIKVILLALALCFVATTGWTADVHLADVPTETTMTPATDTVVVVVGGVPSQITGSNLLTGIGGAAANADTTGSAGSVKSPATTGKTTITGPAAGATRAKTVRDADDTIIELGTTLGTFTGTTIADNATTQGALQALETSLETKQASAAAIKFTGPLTAGHWLKVNNADGTVEDAGLPIDSSGLATSGGPFIPMLDNGNPAKLKEAALPPHLVAGGTTAPTLTVVTPEVNGSAHVDLTAAQMKGPGAVVYNTGQTNADVFLALPTAAAGLSALFTVGTTQAGNHWGVQADTNDKIYLIDSAGAVSAGTDNQAVWMVAATIGQSFACWTFKTDAYDWQCRAIALAGSTFVAGAAH